MKYDKILIQSDFSQRFIDEMNKREKLILRQGDWGEVEASKSKVGDGYGRQYTITLEPWIVGRTPPVVILRPGPEGQPARKIIAFDMVAYNAEFQDALQDVLSGLGLDNFEPIYFNAVQELLPAYFKS